MVVSSVAKSWSAAYALAFTIGPGNDVQAKAIQALRGHLLGFDVQHMCADLGAFSRHLVYDSHLRWLGPEKGVMHMAIGAVVNAAWDLAAKRAGIKQVINELAIVVDSSLVDGVITTTEWDNSGPADRESVGLGA